MGLDMYLFKLPKIKKYSFEEVLEHKNNIVNDLEGFKKSNYYEDFKPYIVERGEHFKWFDLTEEIGYWRKANQIHKWFVDCVQERNR